MKRLLLLLTLVASLSCMSVKADSYTANSSDIKEPGKVPTTWTSNNVTWNMSYTWQSNGTYTGTDTGTTNRGFQIITVR